MKKTAIILFIAIITAIAATFQTFATPFGITPNEPLVMQKTAPVIDGSISSDEGWSTPAHFNEATANYFGGTKLLLTGSGEMYFAYTDEGLCFGMKYVDLGAAYCVKVFQDGDNIYNGINGYTIVVKDADAVNYSAREGGYPSAIPAELAGGQPADIGYYVSGTAIEPELDPSVSYALAYWFSTAEMGIYNSIRPCDDEDYISDGEAVWNGDVFVLALDPNSLFNNSNKGGTSAAGYAIGINSENEVMINTYGMTSRDVTSVCEASGYISADNMTAEFEIMIPWETVAEDYNDLAARAKLGRPFTAEGLANGGTHRASVSLYDRYYDTFREDNDDYGYFSTSSRTGRRMYEMTLTIGEGYADVPSGTWYTDAVMYCRENALMNGTDKDVFSPDMTVSRAQAALVLAKISGDDLNQYLGIAPFSDVDANQWYSTAVAWARDAGVTDGYSDGRFGPNDPVNREQLAVFMYKLAKHMGRSTTASASLEKFKDANMIDAWAYTAMSWANAKGVLSGNNYGELMPLSRATRSQFAVMAKKLVTDVLK